MESACRRVPFLLLSLASLSLPLAGQDQHDLRLHLRAGDQQCFQHSTRRQQTTEVRGQELVIETRIEHTLALAITAVAADGTVQAQLTVVRTQGSMTLPPVGEVAFDSASTEEPDAQGIGPAMCAFAGRTYGLQVAGNGEVLAVQGAAEALAAAKRHAFGTGAQLLGGQIDAAMLQAVAQSLFGLLPKAPVAVGGDWPHEVKTDLRGTPLLTRLRYRLEQVDGKTAKLASSATISTPEAKPDQLRMVKGEMRGTEIVALPQGLIESAERESTTELVGPSPLGDGELAIHGVNTTKVKRLPPEAAQLPKPAAGKPAATPAKVK